MRNIFTVYFFRIQNFLDSVFFIKRIDRLWKSDIEFLRRNFSKNPPPSKRCDQNRKNTPPSNRFSTFEGGVSKPDFDFAFCRGGILTAGFLMSSGQWWQTGFFSVVEVLEHIEGRNSKLWVWIFVWSNSLKYWSWKEKL